MRMVCSRQRASATHTKLHQLILSSVYFRIQPFSHTVSVYKEGKESLGVQEWVLPHELSNLWTLKQKQKIRF